MNHSQRLCCFGLESFLAACNNYINKLTGLAIGGDDYITKPFNPLEIIARVKVILRLNQMEKI